jgi:ribonuclease HI
MTAPKPHYLLFCDGNVSANGESTGSQRGRWRFVLEDLVSGQRTEATDQEIACAPDRSALVAVLRGLESLEQPSRVTLVTTSRYVSRGLQYGLTEWRDNDYSWEHFGTVQPIRNADIWKRIDRALAYHQVQCRWMAQEGGAEPQDETESSKGIAGTSPERVTPNPSIQSQATYSAASSSTLSTTSASTSTTSTSTAQTSRRQSKTAGGTRTQLSTSRYQRVYVDTPLVRVEQGEKPVNQSVSSKEPSATLSGNCWPNVTSQVRLVCRGPLWLCSHVWAVIVAIDEWLESFLRCLFLLDPGKRPSRR